MKIRVILLIFAYLLYPLTVNAEFEQTQIQVVNDLTNEFEISGKDFAKPTADAIRNRFKNKTDTNFNTYSEVLFKGSDSFKYTGKNAGGEQKTTDTIAWDKALNTSKRAVGSSQIANSANQDDNSQTKCEKYGKITKCEKTGATK